MTELRLVQVDAFADRPFTGNPAAVVPLDAWLPNEVMQAIALENNLSETAFTVPAEDGVADYGLRWFTPTAEVRLCGHATLAAGHVLMGDRARLRFRTRSAGLLAVAKIEGGYALDLPATRMRPASAADLKDVIARDGAGIVDIITHDGASDAAAPELHLDKSGAEKTAILLMADEAAVRGCRPDLRRLGEIDVMAIITAPADAGAGHDVVSRVFVPAWGVDEDPVTGSAHAALAPFWSERLGRCDAITFFQASQRSGHLTGRLDGERVILGGKCVTVIEGVMRI
jgi:PhzF family phenazine biosynthesis protein